MPEDQIMLHGRLGLRDDFTSGTEGHAGNIDQRGARMNELAELHFETTVIPVTNFRPMLETITDEYHDVIEECVGCGPGLDGLVWSVVMSEATAPYARAADDYVDFGRRQRAREELAAERALLPRLAGPELPPPTRIPPPVPPPLPAPASTWRPIGGCPCDQCRQARDEGGTPTSGFFSDQQLRELILQEVLVERGVIRTDNSVRPRMVGTSYWAQLAENANVEQIRQVSGLGDVDDVVWQDVGAIQEQPRIALPDGEYITDAEDRARRRNEHSMTDPL